MLSNNKYATSGLSTITLSYKIAIVATMSAGKSTLLNAILGTDLIPARNEACTAKIFQLDHHQQDGYELYQNRIGWVKTTASEIDQQNKASNDELIRLRGDIYGLSSSTNPHVQITIYDTPGPNNSMNQSHNDITKDFLQTYDYDMVIYVMNATQFGVNDDRYLLNDLKRIVDTPKKAKIIFALNKADKIDIEKGESIKGLLSEAKKYLKNIGFVNPNVIPISAKATGLARKQKQNMPLTRAERNELTSYIEIIKEETLFDFINHIPSSIEEQYHREIRRIANYQHREGNHQNQALEAIIAQSGLLHLEAFLHTAINNSILLKNKTLIV
jgi:small GTP-binding protein